MSRRSPKPHTSSEMENASAEKKLPPWIDPLICSSFFESCSSHAQWYGRNPRCPARGGCNILCIDCCIAICSRCTQEEHHGHRTIQIRISSFQNVVKVTDIKPFFDLAQAQTHFINGFRVVCINKRPKTTGRWPGNGIDSGCSTCKARLGNGRCRRRLGGRMKTGRANWRLQHPNWRPGGSLPYPCPRPAIPFLLRVQQLPGLSGSRRRARSFLPATRTLLPATRTFLPPGDVHAPSYRRRAHSLLRRPASGSQRRRQPIWTSIESRMSSAASNPSPTTVNQEPSLKRNSDDVGWAYGVLVNPNNLNVIKCKLCGKVVTAGIYRLKCHIAQKKGEVRSCPNATPKDIEKCKKALDESNRAKRARRQEQQEVRDAVVIDVPDDAEETTELDEIGSSGPRAVGPMDQFTKPIDSCSLASTKIQQQKISEHIMKDRLHRLKRYIARWLYVHAISFNAINNDEFDQMLEAAGRFGPGAKKPYQHELREKLLHEEVSDTMELLKLQEKEWAKTGCSIMTDAWTDQKRRSIMNLCVNCSIGTSFIESKEASAYSHTGELIFQYVNSCIMKVGAENVVQVVTDNASNNMAAKDLLYLERPNIFWSSYATHTINLMLEAIGKMKKFKTTLDQAKALTIFIYSHHRTLSLMRKYTKKRDIIRPGVTRFASSFLTLQSLYEKKDQLRMMSQSEKWEKISHITKSTKGVQATATLVKPAFWNGVALCLRVFEPLVKVLRMVDGDIKLSMAFLYGEIKKAKEEIKVAVQNLDRIGTLYNCIMEIINGKMKDRLDTPLHMAAYFLNPYYSYNNESIFDVEDVMDGIIGAVETFYHGDYDKQNQVLNEDLHKFKDQVGHFSKPVAKAGCKDYDFSPAKWWGNYGTQVPTLQKMAVRILSLTSSASGCERNWSCFEGIHTKKRNKLTCERLEQLVFVRFNHLHAKKKNKAKMNKKVDPLLAAEATSAQGWLIEGGEDDEDDTDPVTGLTWKLIAETCGADEVTQLRRSSRLNQARDIEDDGHSELEEAPIDDDEIEFESDQEDMIITGYDEEGRAEE